jgi:hypothetical protein
MKKNNMYSANEGKDEPPKKTRTPKGNRSGGFVTRPDTETPSGDMDSDEEKMAKSIFDNLNLPIARHRTFLLNTFNYCEAKRIGLGLLGSIALDAGSRFSDIDILLAGNAGEDDVRHLIEGFEQPAMGFFTINPKGIITVEYARGFCVELGVRKAVGGDERSQIRFLLQDNFTYAPVTELLDVETIYRPDFVIAADGPRILFKSILKYLNRKLDAAYGLLEEILAPGQKPPRTDFARWWKAAFDEMVSTESLGKEAVEEFEWLYAQVEERAKGAAEGMS